VHGAHEARRKVDWPLANVAVALDLGPGSECRRASIVLGAAAPTPWRTRAAEAVLNGKTVDANLAAEAGREAVDGARP